MMKRRYILTLMATFPILPLIRIDVSAHSYLHGGLEIDHPWMHENREASLVDRVVSMVIINKTNRHDRLISVTSEDAEEVYIAWGSGSQKIPSVDIVAKTATEFHPDAAHLLLKNIRRSYYAMYKGPTVTLNFAKAGRIKVDIVPEEAAEK